MEIKLELLRNYLCDHIRHNLRNIEVDVTEIADTTAILALTEIQKAIQNTNLNDFEVIEELFAIFKKYHLDFGPRHDFG